MRFVTYEDPCEQSKEPGPCEGNFTKWYFNAESQACEQFRYGGCKGNDNNFATEIACHQQCLQPGRTRGTFSSTILLIRHSHVPCSFYCLNPFFILDILSYQIRLKVFQIFIYFFACRTNRRTYISCCNLFDDCFRFSFFKRFFCSCFLTNVKGTEVQLAMGVERFIINLFNSNLFRRSEK